MCVNRKDSKAHGTPRSRSRARSNLLNLFNLLNFHARVVQAALAVNFLGPCAAARARINRFLNARCTTYTTTPHFLSLKAQKCDLTCPSPATAPPGSSSEPGYTTRQICTIRTVSHIPNITLVHTLSISMLKHGTDALRCPPMRLCCCDVDCRRRVDVLALVGRRDELP